jgi:hypothetical protein
MATRAEAWIDCHGRQALEIVLALIGACLVIDGITIIAASPSARKRTREAPPGKGSHQGQGQYLDLHLSPFRASSQAAPDDTG